jgi:predicted nucleic acid-binding Zn ribbon protein
MEVMIGIMPVYEYQHVGQTGEKAQVCQEIVEVEQRFAEPALTVCPHCGAAVERLIPRVQVMKAMMSDSRLKDLGFRKLKKDADGNFRDQWQAPPISESKS